MAPSSTSCSEHLTLPCDSSFVPSHPYPAHQQFRQLLPSKTYPEALTETTVRKRITASDEVTSLLKTFRQLPTTLRIKPNLLNGVDKALPNPASRPLWPQPSHSTSPGQIKSHFLFLLFWSVSSSFPTRCLCSRWSLCLECFSSRSPCCSLHFFFFFF